MLDVAFDDAAQRIVVIAGVAVGAEMLTCRVSYPLKDEAKLAKIKSQPASRWPTRL